jgi:hypothetical protein
VRVSPGVVCYLCAALAALAGAASESGGFPGRAPVHRSGTITTTPPPSLAVPIADSVRWTSVPLADRYRVTVYDDAGTLLLDTSTPDTAVALPVGLPPGPARYWSRVEARTGWDRWVESEWASFTVGR